MKYLVLHDCNQHKFQIGGQGLAEMATEYGTCGSWKSVQRMLGGPARQSQCPNDLSNLIRELESQRGRWPQEAAADVQEKIGCLRANVSRLKAEASAATATARRRFSPDIARLRSTLDGLSQHPLILMRWYNRLWRVPRLRRQIVHLEDKVLAAARSAERASVAACEELIAFEQNPQSHVQRCLAQRESQLRTMQAVAASAEFAGAVGEFQMAEMLAEGLAREFHVFHDVHVETSDWVYADGEHRRSAQIDHVVVGPGGVFALEDKLWSKGFAERGNYHDPYRQLRWAGKLCHLVLTDRVGVRIKVREVLVASGVVPPQPRDSFAKVKRPEAVCGFIRWFNPELDVQVVDAVVRELRRMC